MILCGTIITFPAGDTLSTCSIECMQQSWCTCILFDGNSNIQDRCNLISSHPSLPIDLTNMSGHDYFTKNISCRNMGISTPKGWRSGCPKLYFPLDSDQSATYGGSSGNADFSSAGILGHALYIENSPTLPSAYHNLGWSFTSDQFCFSEPSLCVNGVSYAFWMKIPIEPMSTSGYLSTKLPKGPGFAVYWSSYTGMTFLVRRDFDTKQDFVAISGSNFTMDYGFNVWVHYLITYRLV